MPSEVEQKENDISIVEKEIKRLDTKDEVKENGSQGSKIEGEVQGNNTSEESKISDIENKEPNVEDIESQKKLAGELLIEGKRHLIIKDFQAAADVLSEACSLFGTVYGEMAEECAEAYFLYGCALLELSKDQINPVGLEENDDDENEDVSIQEDSVSDTGKNNVGNEEKKATISNKEEQSNEVENKSSEKETLPEDQEEEEENEENPDEDIAVDDVNDLQLAWEMLELAKVIYKNKDTEESKLKLAEVLMKCGEVSIEDEKFETAIEDMTESLQIRRLLLPEDSRVIAETLFQLGIAQELGGSGEQAIELLSEAASVLDQRIATLENSTENKDLAKEEVAEVKSIIPEIREKIVDIRERKKAAVYALLAAVGASNDSVMNGGTSSTSKQASNISHLVRKRPKQDETNGTPNKIPKIEEKSTAGKQ